MLMLWSDSGTPVPLWSDGTLEITANLSLDFD